MARFFGYIVLLLFLSVYLVSSDNVLTNKLLNKRASLNSAFAANGHNYGDLYSLSLLTQYKIPVRHTSNIPLIKCNLPAQTYLYTLCDSHIWEFIADKKYYCGVDSFRWFNTTEKQKLDINLDHKKNNIFLFEISERKIRETLNDTGYINHVIHTQKTGTSLAENDHSFFFKIKTFIFNGAINTNLELNIWDYQLFSTIKEFKANLNYKLNLVDKSVVIAPDKKQLFYTPTIDTTQITSSFKNISDQEIETIVDRLNIMYDNAKKSGFDEAYLAMIPNPVSVLYPNYNGLKYNDLINRIQRSPKLKIKIVDAYSLFKKARTPVYSLSDTHWNPDGVHIWLNAFNSQLAKQSTEWSDRKRLNN
jgi:hypothetical protein